MIIPHQSSNYKVPDTYFVSVAKKIIPIIQLNVSYLGSTVTSFCFLLPLNWEKREGVKDHQTPIPSESVQVGFPNYWTICTMSWLKFNRNTNLL